MEVRVEDSKVAIARGWRYWSVDVKSRSAYGEQEAEKAAGRLLELITDSVQLRLRRDVPGGSCLSGGLDSSTIVSPIRRLEPALGLGALTRRLPEDPPDEGRDRR